MAVEPTIVGLSYSEFVKQYGEQKAKEALKRFYGTDDVKLASQIAEERMKQIVSQPQSIKVKIEPISPGYNISTGQPVTNPYSLTKTSSSSSQPTQTVQTQTQLHYSSAFPERILQKDPNAVVHTIQEVGRQEWVIEPNKIVIRTLERVGPNAWKEVKSCLLYTSPSPRD